jgi:hypothetical protein
VKPGRPVQFECISEARGLPEDLSPELQDRFCDEYCFSYSWLYIDEILGYDLQNKYILSGGERDARIAPFFDPIPKGFPEKFSHVTWPDDLPEDEFGPYRGVVAVQWLEPYSEVFKGWEFFCKQLEKFKTPDLSEKERIVFCLL